MKGYLLLVSPWLFFYRNTPNIRWNVAAKPYVTQVRAISSKESFTRWPIEGAVTPHFHKSAQVLLENGFRDSDAKNGILWHARQRWKRRRRQLSVGYLFSRNPIVVWPLLALCLSPLWRRLICSACRMDVAPWSHSLSKQNPSLSGIQASGKQPQRHWILAHRPQIPTNAACCPSEGPLLSPLSAAAHCVYETYRIAQSRCLSYIF